ncbi:hypothetical protein [Pseudoalteromonas rubra]|uniref:Uncharacterized protein n=1 Tax=Pseudoalteromonas rubra TaxID=43658 RepID=A0A0U3I111_9GAMM|nr:hypothetical protein [Pseudoalteromonas rubra]ALU43574.1 hypothetical protein AT705_11810 [Pseudoalteromonas rubra]
MTTKSIEPVINLPLTLSIVFFSILLGFGFLSLWKTSRLGETQSASETIQNLATTIAIAFGGIWAYYSFDIQEQAERANTALLSEQAKLQELKKDIENTEASTISMDFKVVNYASPHKDYMDETKGLIIEINIENKGKSKLVYNLDRKPMVVYEVEAAGRFLKRIDARYPNVYDEISSDEKTQSTYMKRVVSLKSSKKTLSYFATVKPKTLYYVVFSTELDPSDYEKDDFKDICSDESCNWFVSRYIYID